MLDFFMCKFSFCKGTVKIGGAEVTLPDVTAGNGVVHVIDK